jgi:hypothetical protein
MKVTKLVTGLLAIGLTGFISTAPQKANAQSAACYVNVNGTLMHLVTGSLESCARTIQATRPGYGQMAVGQWGNHEVAVDQNSTVYVDGQSVGRARNVSGTYGSLSDRCMSGDVAACKQWSRQLDHAINQYNRMFRNKEMF